MTHLLAPRVVDVPPPLQAVQADIGAGFLLVVDRDVGNCAGVELETAALHLNRASVPGAKAGELEGVSVPHSST